ncbi:MAG TPA: protein kinase [Polyangia bacterium]
MADTSGPTSQEPVPAATDPRIGRVLQDRYRITGIIAAGGMGIVYRGERVGLGRVVAIKFLHAAMARDPLVARRFEVEARAMSRLCHPNCIGVLDFGVDELPYVVIDHASGESLDVLIEKGPMAPRRAIKIVRQILAALAHAHAHGIVHRDIKPENVVVEQNPGLDDHVRLLDFGLAKLTGTDLGLTAGLAVGTPHYMAPEQMAEGTVDGRADLYSVGIVLFELLTGQKPFDSADLTELLMQHIGAPPPPLREVAPWSKFSGPLEAVVMRALSKRPEQRYPSADAMSAALDDTPEAQTTGGPELHPGGSLSAEARRAAEQAHARDATVPWSSARALAVSRDLATLGPEVPPASPDPKTQNRGRRPFFLDRPFWLAATGGLGASVLAGAMVVLGFSGSQAPGQSPVEQTAPAEANVAPAKGPRSPAKTRTSQAIRPTGKAGATSTANPAGRRTASNVANQTPSATDALARGRRAFSDKRPLDGIDAFREAVRLDPKRRGDAALVNPVIGGLAGEKRAACEGFLRELGRPAHPHLREAAASHADPHVRTRAAALLPAAPASPKTKDKPAPPPKKPFLRWL